MTQNSRRTAGTGEWGDGIGRHGWKGTEIVSWKLG